MEYMPVTISVFVN